MRPNLQAALSAYYQSDLFLYHGGDRQNRKGWEKVRRVFAADPCAVKAARANAYFTRLLKEPLSGMSEVGCRPPGPASLPSSE